MIVLLVFASAVWAGSRVTEEPGATVAKVQAERFRFVPSRIKVAAGARLTLELESLDVEHGFELPSMSTEVVIPARGQGSVTVELPEMEPGRYRFRCSRNCGAGHAGMRGVIVVK